MLTFDEFAQWSRSWDDVIAVRRCYIDMAGDLASGVMLSQIVYWHIPSQKRDGGSKLQIELDGFLWLVKSREDWWEECRLSPKQADRALSVLRERGLIETRLHKFNGAPTIHLRLLKQEFMRQLTVAVMPASEGKMDIDRKVNSNSTDGEERSSPMRKKNLPKAAKSLSNGTKTTAEITQKFQGSKPLPADALDAAQVVYTSLTPQAKSMIDREAEEKDVDYRDLVWKYHNAEAAYAMRDLQDRK